MVPRAHWYAGAAPHSVEPAREKVPGGQGSHASAAAALGCTEKVLAGQGVTEGEPAPQKKPGGQSWQIVIVSAPGNLEYVPAGQGLHAACEAIALSKEYVPAAQSEQEVLRGGDRGNTLACNR